MIYCTTVSGLTAGSSFANVADVGGTYNGVWVQGVSRWVTTVYGKKFPPLRYPELATKNYVENASQFETHFPAKEGPQFRGPSLTKEVKL